MIRRKVRRCDLEADPYRTWNEFIDLIAVEQYEELSQIQKTASLLFWYDSEVNNGGHLKYFSNSAGEKANETVEALSATGLNCQRDVLNNATFAYSQEVSGEITSSEDFVSEALEGKLDVFDEHYYRCRPRTIEFLESYLEENLNEFIELIES